MTDSVLFVWVNLCTDLRDNNWSEKENKRDPSLGKGKREPE
jgi:hypothetical protein